MRRRSRALSATVLMGAVWGAAAPSAQAEGAAEVSPQTVAPGGTITISVSCDPTDGPAPETIGASSQAFTQGTVQFRRVSGDDDSVDGPSYQGTARIAPAEDFETGPDAMGADTEWGVDGTCPAAPGGEGKQWGATFSVAPDGDADTVSPGGDGLTVPSDGDADTLSSAGDGPTLPSGGDAHDPARHPTYQPTHRPTHDSTHLPAPVRRGVHAGSGGAFTDSVPALVAGGLLIAGALGAAVHRLRRRGRWTP